MILAIDTATEACSVALFDGKKLVAEQHEVVGRGHAERLAPMIAELPNRDKISAILVDCGPGSFTGVRVGLAVARGLGLAWQSQVCGYSSLFVIAAQAFAADSSIDKAAVTLLGGHGEYFVQRFSASPFAAVSALQSLKPEEALDVIEEPVLLGSAAAELVARGAVAEARGALPRAASTILLPEPDRSLPPSPIYGRAPDATPQS